MTEQEMKKRSSIVSYTVSGYKPSSSTFTFLEGDVANIVRSHCKVYLDDISDVTIEILNRRTGAIEAIVWIPENSHNICNTDLRGNNSAVNKTVMRYSEKVKEMLKRYGIGSKRMIRAEQRNLRVVGFEIDLKKIFEVELDASGAAYGKEFGDDQKRRTTIIPKAYFAKAEDNKAGKLRYIEVKKSLTGLTSAKPTPRRSYHA